MISLLLPALMGLVAGFVHVLSGPDHLLAIAPIAGQSRQNPWRSGLFWGVGHTAGVLLVGAVALWLRELVPVAWLSSHAERLVGVALIGIGLWGIRKALSGGLHAHQHRHQGVDHTHFHMHDPREAHQRQAGHQHTHLSFLIGILHGFAGSAHLLGVLPALAMPTVPASVAYLLFFGVGSISAMVGFSMLIGLVLSRMERSPGTLGGVDLYRLFLTTLSGAAVALGVIWVAWPPA